MKTRHAALSFTLLALTVATYACGGDDSGAPIDAGGGDAATDAGPTRDATTDGQAAADDSGRDGGRDVQTPGDAAPDANDAGPDGDSVDAGPDANDAAPDADDGGIDAGPDGDVDAGDSGWDAGPPGPTVMAIRVGDGTFNSTQLTSASPVFIEERQIKDGRLIRTIPLPTTTSGDSHPCTLNLLRGGGLSLSTDGHFLVTGGYAADAGAPDLENMPSSSSDGGAFLPRVVARIDPSGAVDSSTLIMGALDQGGILSVASVDGSAFWVGGSGNPFGDGVLPLVYLPLRSAGGFAPMLDKSISLAALGIFGGSLYATYNQYSTSTGPQKKGIGQIGTGLPTSSAATIAQLVPIDPSQVVPASFVFFDTDGQNGPDLLYMANAAGSFDGGILKWTLTNGQWTQTAKLTPSGLPGGRSQSTDWLAASRAADGTVTLVASTHENVGTGNDLIAGIDDGTTSPAFTVLAHGAPNEAYRGVAFPPK